MRMLEAEFNAWSEDHPEPFAVYKAKQALKELPEEQKEIIRDLLRESEYWAFVSGYETRRNEKRQ